MTKEKESKYKEFYSEFGKCAEEIREKTLLGDFWGKFGAVSYQKQLVNPFKAYRRWHKIYKYNSASIFPVESFSVVSSTYYAASGNAASRAKVPNLFLKVFWYWRAWRCLQIAKKYSDKFASLKKMENMSLGELDVRACILNKAGRRNEAAGLLSHGIMEILTNKIGTKHDLCLFLIHEAEIITGMRKYDKENKAEKNYQQAMELTEDGAVPILTMVRVMKSYGKFLAGSVRITEAKDILRRALRLTEENGRFDQAVKIKALLASVR